MLNIMMMLVILGLVVYPNVEPVIKSFSKEAIKNFNSVLNTICHELRHAWQHDKDFLMTYFYITPETNYKLYKMQPMEVDARAFAAYFVHYKLNNKRKEEILEHILASMM